MIKIDNRGIRFGWARIGSAKEFVIGFYYTTKSGEDKLLKEMSKEDHWLLQVNNKKYPLPILIADEKKGQIFLFNDNFYIVNNEAYYSNEDLKALILAKELKNKKKIERAKSFVTCNEKGINSSRYINDDVKESVWRRDGGKCVKYGATAKLEFDHIIPLSMGGSNTVRNIQLLCESCNRDKAGNIT